MRRALLLLALALAGCAELVDGNYTCASGDDDDCPPDWSCWSDLTCHSVAEAGNELGGECAADADCKTAYTCVPRLGTGEIGMDAYCTLECSTDGDCAAFEGTGCVGGHCRLECAMGQGCPEGLVCRVPVPEPRAMPVTTPVCIHPDMQIEDHAFCATGMQCPIPGQCARAAVGGAEDGVCTYACMGDGECRGPRMGDGGVCEEVFDEGDGICLTECTTDDDCSEDLVCGSVAGVSDVCIPMAWDGETEPLDRVVPTMMGG